MSSKGRVDDAAVSAKNLYRFCQFLPAGGSDLYHLVGWGWEMSERDSAVEALAEAWASLDGKMSDFIRGKRATSIEAYGGYYAGYLSDASELLNRWEKRGFSFKRKRPSPRPTKEG